MGITPKAKNAGTKGGVNKLALMVTACRGGANAPVTVGIGTEEEIDAAVRAAIKTLGPTRFILNASIYICDNDVTWDRFLTFVDA